MTIDSSTNFNNNESIFKIFAKAVWFALTSGLVLLSGYLSRGGFTHNVILLLIPFGFSFWFFVIYFYCFNYNNNIKIDKRAKEILGVCFWFITIPIALITILTYALLTSHLPSLSISISFVVFAWMYFKYGSFLFNIKNELNKRGPDEDLPMRHRIMWPTMLTIAFSLYYGMFFETLIADYFVYFYLPIVPIILLFLFSVKNSDPKIFVISNFVFWPMAILTSVILSFRGMPIPFEAKSVTSALLISTAVAMYLGILESWRVTAYVRNKYTDFSSEMDIKLPTSITLKWEKFYYSTLGLLMLSITCIPFLFIFSPFGVSFLYLFTTHAIVSLIIWGKFGRRIHLKRFLIIKTNNKNIHDYWMIAKNFMVFIFLIILVSALAFKSSVNTKIISIELNSFIIAILISLVLKQGNLLKNEYELYSRKNLDISTRIWLFLKIYMNLLRLSSVIAFIFCILLVILKLLFPNSNKTIKSDYSFILYVILIIYSILFEIYYYIRRKNGGRKMVNIITRVFGIGQTTRITTSLVISLIVLLPNFKEFSFNVHVIISSINLLLTSMGGFALNDYFDTDKDIINKPHRPIPSQRISRKTCLFIACSLLSTSLFISIYSIANNAFGYVQLVLLSAMVLYNYVTKYFAVTKTIYTAFISSLLVSFPIFTNKLDVSLYLLPLATFFFILGRELLMDILDIEGDKKSGINTIPIIWGKRKTFISAFFSLLIGLSLILPLILPANNIIDLIRVLLIFLSLIGFFLFWSYGSITIKKIAIIYLWIPMIAGLTLLFL